MQLFDIFDSFFVSQITNKVLSFFNKEVAIKDFVIIMDTGKGIHYTERKRLLLAQLISEEKVIENKGTGATTLKDKTDAWDRVTKKYVSEGCTPRSSKQLKKCWDNMKQK